MCLGVLGYRILSTGSNNRYNKDEVSVSNNKHQQECFFFVLFRSFLSAVFISKKLIEVLSSDESQSSVQNWVPKILCIAKLTVISFLWSWEWEEETLFKRDTRRKEGEGNERDNSLWINRETPSWSTSWHFVPERRTTAVYRYTTTIHIERLAIGEL